MMHQVVSRLQDLELVEIASLLHDIQDWKYSGSETAAETTVKVGLSMPFQLCLQTAPKVVNTDWFWCRSISNNIAIQKTDRQLF